jgi:hypothetical protein
VVLNSTLYPVVIGDIRGQVRASTCLTTPTQPTQPTPSPAMLHASLIQMASDAYGGLFDFSSLSEWTESDDSGPDEVAPLDSGPPSPSLPPFEAHTQTLPSTLSQEQATSGNSIGARIIALTKFDKGVLHEEITLKTGVSRSSLYKLRSKAISRG